MKAVFLLFAVVVALGVAFMRSGAIDHPPGVLVADEPVQVLLADAEPFRHADHMLSPLAEFSLSARVLSRRTYRFDREADLAPLDLALGWGPMSDSAVLARIDIAQRDRFFFWRTDAFPIPRGEIERNAANMHIIPADDAVADELAALRAGHIVQLSGRLVEARAADGWRWRSSLSRSDTGRGACELFYVERVAYR